MNKATVRFEGGAIGAEVASSMISRSLGLSFRKIIKGNEGMLFIFSSAHRPTFWNFGMRFPIDVIWIRDSLVVGIEEDIPPMKEGVRIFTPKDNVDSVLEVPAGTARRMGIGLCDKIDIVFTS